MYIALWCGFSVLYASNSIEIPLRMSVVKFKPSDSPTGSTPDPTDPNQFRATLTGNTLTVYTQKDAVSYVVIRSDFSEQQDRDYFYGLSYDSVSCPITQAGNYMLYIGYWNTDFVGVLSVKNVTVSDLNGKVYSQSKADSSLPPGFYIIRLDTHIGSTTTKIYKLP